jgi:hypothetical protein
VTSETGLQNYSDKLVGPLEPPGDEPEFKIEVRICNACNVGTTFFEDFQLPKPLRGETINSDGKDKALDLIVKLYGEARKALSQDCPSCAVLMFRKLLMHIAVQQGAKPRLRFVDYVDHLKSESVIGKPLFPLLDRIKDAGNEENHEIKRATTEEAEDLLNAVTHLIKSIYPQTTRSA